MALDSSAFTLDKKCLLKLPISRIPVLQPFCFEHLQAGGWGQDAAVPLTTGQQPCQCQRER